MARLTVIAGVNGSGKSTLVNELEKIMDIGVKINADEIAKEFGDFNNKLIQEHAGRQTLKIIADCIENKTDFNFETTFSGKGILRKIDDAKNNDFDVDLIYIAIEKKTSKLRINSRVLKGGHNIPDLDIERRYDRSVNNFINNANRFQNVYFYENEGSKHNLIFVIENGKFVYINEEIPEWIKIRFKFDDLINEFPV
jgi:predicted ABC-type ATPase